MPTLSANKQVVYDFNIEVIQNNKRQIFDSLMAEDFVNRSGPDGNNGMESMWHTFKNVIKPAFPDLQVTIHQMVEENGIVTTRKSISGTHLGELMNIKPTGKKVTIDVIDMVRVQDGKYREHWGINTFERVIKSLADAAAMD